MSIQMNAIKADGSNGAAVELTETVFGRDYNEALIHQVVTAFMAGGRAGTRAQKTRSEVSGGGAKPFRQKGTGRARAGTSRSPIWRGGGITFAAKPQNYVQKVNRKMYRAGMQSILSELLRTERLIMVEDFAIDEAKTKLAQQALSNLQVGNGTVLIVVEEYTETMLLAMRNLPNIDVLIPEDLDPVSLVGFDKVVMTVAAAKQLSEDLS